MRISDLSRRTNVPVATIKFYLRERLLPAGTPTGRNQAEYGETHVRRLRLIRAFTGIGQLDLSTVRELLAAIEANHLSLPELYDLVTQSISPAEPATGETFDVRRARADVDDFIVELGWRVVPDAASRDRLAHVLAALQHLGCGCGVEFFKPYAAAAEHLAVRELDLLPADGQNADRAAAVVRTILLEVALAALRRMAQEHHVTLRFARTTAEPA
ncbi:MerR family transcriptional regulator [Micromonospora sp. NPDC007230]|uniref:MerR family transcriptional regulator n=1 Tax=Micromonospora sp. NPDC007230 TaxID=3364237 RepID=UPI003691442A